VGAGGEAVTREDIIRMARQAGFPDYAMGLASEDAWQKTELFAALVATTEKQKVVEYMNSRAFATGHGDTIEDLLKEMEWQVAEREREACAKIADSQINNTAILLVNPGKSAAAWDIANAIRARGSK
jgi:hypothetical protein